MITALLITGCSYGLGRALALKFAKNNYRVYAVGRSRDLLEELIEMSPNIEPIIADITTEIGRLKINEHLNKEKSISIIHNAAVLEPCSFKLASEALLRDHVETNYLAPLLITKSLLSKITKGQRILHITSGAANLAISGLMPYCTTKAAMQFAIECLNAEINPTGVYCANLRPGMVDTPMNSKLRDVDKNILPNRDFYTRLKNENKLISPETAAEFVAWVLLKTENLDFSTTAWNIYDETHHHHWLPDNAKIPIGF